MFGENWEYAWATLIAVCEALGEGGSHFGNGMYFWMDTGEAPAFRPCASGSLGNQQTGSPARGDRHEVEDQPDE
jgi:hypothetical protein